MTEGIEASEQTACREGRGGEPGLRARPLEQMTGLACYRLTLLMSG